VPRPDASASGGRALALALRVLDAATPTTSTPMPNPSIPSTRALIRTAIWLSFLLLPGCVVFTCRV
jgi:hypothetical protein